MLPIRLGPWPAAFATLLLTLAAAPAAAAPRQQAAAGQPADQSAATIEWLTDAEGRQYRLEPLPKAQGVKTEDGRVRTIWGVQADLAKEDDQFWYIKVYNVGPPPTVLTPSTAAGAAGARRAAAAGTAPGGAKAAPAPAPARPEPLPRASQRLRWTDMSAGLPTAGQWREGLVLADVTGDGRLDIVLSPARKSLRGPVIFSYDGKTWARDPKRMPPAAYDYGDVAVGDVTGDGKPDLLFGVHLKGLLALTAGPDGTYAVASEGLPFSKGSADPVFSTRAVTLADCNGDQRPELIALGEGPRLPTGGAVTNTDIATGVATFARQEDGTWKTLPMAAADGLFGSSIASGDADGDGKIDIVVAPGTLGDTRLLLRGDGACGWQAEKIDAARERSYFGAVAAGDLDGDGRSDIVVGYSEFAGDQPAYGLDLLTRNAEGRWTRKALSRAPGRGRYQAIAIGDIDADGANDIAAVDDVGTVQVFLGDGRGTLTAERTTIPSAGQCQGSSLAIGDLDRDGLADIAVGYAQEKSSAQPNACPGEGNVSVWRTQRAASTASGTSSKAAPAKPAAR